MDSHSSPAAFKYPVKCDRTAGACTSTLSRRAPVACTATVLVGLSPVAPSNGTIVTSDSSCDRVSAGVVAAPGAFVPLRSGFVPVQAPATMAPVTSITKMPVKCTALPVGLRPLNQLRPRRAGLPLTIPSLPVVLSLWNSPTPGRNTVCFAGGA